MKSKDTFIVVLLLLFAFLQSAVAGDTLVNSGTIWKYLDDGSDQDTAWIQPTFIDTAWSSGPSKLGYGDNDELTVVSFGSDANDKHITTYFRTTFITGNPAIYKGLRLYVKKDDGIVLYLNGHEILRSNMPSDTIKYDTEAQYAMELGWEEFFVLTRMDPSILLNGINVIAAEVHQAKPTSDDLGFDLMLIADTAAEIIRGPYLQTVTPHSIKVCYRTSAPDVSKVYYGTSIAYTDSVIDTTLVIDHIVELPGLTAGTKYYYSVNSSHKKLSGDTTNYFYSAPAPNSNQPVRIWVMGDMGAGNRKQLATRDAYYNYNLNKYTDLMLWLGDNAYHFGSDEEYTANVFTNHYEDYMKKTVVYSTAGNHDLYYANSVTGTGVYYDIFSFPTNGEAGGVPSGKESYYSFDYSNIHFVCLESNIDSIGFTNVSYMLNWLQMDLTVNTLPWTIVFFHYPPYTKGYHDSDIESDLIYIRQVINPILEAHNVDLVLTGHSHSYERSYLIKGHYGTSVTLDSTMIRSNLSGTPPFVYNKSSVADSGTVYAVVGNTSALTPVSADWPHPVMYSALDTVYGSLMVEVNGDTLHGKMISESLAISDHFSIVKNITTGIKNLETEKGSYLIFPQPVGNELNIRAKFALGMKQVSIINNLGQQVSLHSVLNADNFVINVSELMAGFYIVKIKDDTGVHIQKFLKN